MRKKCKCMYHLKKILESVMNCYKSVRAPPSDHYTKAAQPNCDGCAELADPGTVSPDLARKGN